MRLEGGLTRDARVAIIDLDVHRGNGFEAIYAEDPRVEFFDIYNFQIYPGRHSYQAERWQFLSGLRAHMDDEGYFNVLKKYLPEFLDRGPYALAFYNAGTDVLAGDPLGV
jgi:histone deacetylase 11